MSAGTVASDPLADLGRKYLWWAPPDGGHTRDRTIAQIMNLGTYDDILRLEDMVGYRELARVMASAQPGWLSARSWEFWRGRLAHRIGAQLADRPPQRNFDNAV